MKEENGLTILGTVILIVLITFIVFGVIYFFRIETEKESLENLKTDMLLVEVKVKNIMGEYLMDEKEELLIGTKLSDLKEQEDIKNFLEKKLFDENEKKKLYYVLNQDDLKILELNQVTLPENSYYIVEYTEGKIYYTAGFTYTDGNTYYEIRDIENLKSEE